MPAPKFARRTPAQSAGFTALAVLGLLFVGLLPLAAATVASSPEADSIQAVLATNARMTAAADRLDTEAFFADIVDSDESRIIQDGKFFKTRAETMAAVRAGSQRVAKLERVFDRPQVSLLAQGIALLTADGSTAITLQDGRTFQNRFAVSLVFVLRDGRWKLFHGHYSLPNPNP